MAYKIYRRGGYFYIVDTATNRERDGLAKDVRVTRGTINQTDFHINNVNDWKSSTAIPIASIQDEKGNPYTTDSFIEFYEAATSTDVNIQDSQSPLMIVRASKIVIETTITSETALDDYIINVTSAASFVVGQYLTIYNADSDRVFFSNILAINTLAITLDTPLDFAFPIGSFVSVADTNMNVNGSVTPQIFGIRNPTALDIPLAFDITRVMFKCLTDGSVDLSKFGDIAGGLTRGIVIRKVDGTYQNIFNAKTNGELKNIMYDLDIQAASGNQQDGFTGRLTFGGQNKLGAVVRIGEGEDFQVVIQDDLTSLGTFNVIAEGSQVVS